MANQCAECGCTCTRCCSSNDRDVHLHVEIENLKQRLVERDNHIVKMETNFLNEANKFPNGELVGLREELLTWQDKYKRLYEAHRRVQRVNQGLEDKLLRLVDICETDKGTLTKDVATLSHKLAEANYTIKKLTEDNERYKNDVALAIQFLQCKPTNFVSQKFDTLPNEVQAKVSMYMANKRKPEERKAPPEIKSIKVPIPTFPPTAMVYSVPKSPNTPRRQETDVENNPVDIVSAAIMAKVLEERERERSCVKHCDTCTCNKTLKIINNITSHSISTQTGDGKTNTCLKCNSNTDHFSKALKIVKSSTEKSKNVPIYIHENSENTPQIVAKVQPNNCLIDAANKTETVATSKLINIDDSEQESSNDTEVQEVAFFSENEKTKTSIAVKPLQVMQAATYHALCDRNIPIFDEVTTTSNTSVCSDGLKGPRYCAMRLQTGSKNILLDNVHNNVAPVMYTRHEPVQKIIVESCKDSLSSGEKSNSVISDSSFQNQRVAEWIRNNMDVVPSSSENSRSGSLQSVNVVGEPKVDHRKYAEMESNVKKFLFGESEFSNAYDSCQSLIHR